MTTNDDRRQQLIEDSMPLVPPAEPELTTGDLTVSCCGGALTFTFGAGGVLVRLPCDAILMPLTEWHHLARVYGKIGS
jgi:hypothetical protein